MNENIDSSKIPTSSEIEKQLDLLTQESFDGKTKMWSPKKLLDLDSYQNLKSKSTIYKIELIKSMLNKLIFYNSNNLVKYYHSQVYSKLLSKLINSKLELSSNNLEAIVKIIAKHPRFPFHFLPKKSFLKRIEILQEDQGLTDELVNNLKKCKITPSHKEFYEHLVVADKDYNLRIENIYFNHFGNSIKILDDDKFGTSVNNFLEQLPSDEITHWQELCKKIIKVNSSTKPTKKWQKETSQLIEKIEKKDFISFVNEHLELAINLYKEAYKNYDSEALTTKNRLFLINLIWTVTILHDESLISKIDQLGLTCVKKIKGYGQVDTKIVNTCLNTLALLPFELGVVVLTKYKSKIKYASTLKIIDNRIREIAEREGKSSSEIEELSAPKLGLNESHNAEIKIGDCKAIIQIEGLQNVTLNWLTPKGKTQKTLPTYLKEDFKNDIKEVKTRVKEIKEALLAQRFRIEKSFLQQRTWQYADFLENYIKQPLVGYLGKRIIWIFSNKDKKTTAIFKDDKWFNPEEGIIDWIDKDSIVELWHPIESSVELVSNWRNWLMDNEIQQAFKQAFREIYLVTDAEINTDTYSNRFAAHIIRQFQFNALCQARTWKYTLQGAWDSHNTPFINLENWNIKAEFWVDANHETTDTHSGIYQYVFTDQVRFYRGVDQLRMNEVPPIVFSEIMRDVDLFVGVTSIGNDPDWQDAGNDRFNRYWASYSTQSLTENAKTRKLVLEKLIPRLKIADKCSFSDRYLIVKGQIRTYKIHIGSGNILMEPNDQYLCIVPDQSKRNKNKFYLPFEGDNTLSIIISKAFLLAEDHKIKDVTITRQIGK